MDILHETYTRFCTPCDLNSLNIYRRENYLRKSYRDKWNTFCYQYMFFISPAVLGLNKKISNTPDFFFLRCDHFSRLFYFSLIIITVLFELLFSRLDTCENVFRNQFITQIFTSNHILSHFCVIYIPILSVGKQFITQTRFLIGYNFLCVSPWDSSQQLIFLIWPPYASKMLQFAVYQL